MFVQQIRFAAQAIIIGGFIGTIETPDHFKIAVDIFIFDQFGQEFPGRDALGKNSLGFFEPEFLDHGTEIKLDIAAANAAVAATRPLARPHGIKNNDISPGPSQHKSSCHADEPGPDNGDIGGRGNGLEVRFGTRCSVPPIRREFDVIGQGGGRNVTVPWSVFPPGIQRLVNSA